MFLPLLLVLQLRAQLREELRDALVQTVIDLGRRGCVGRRGGGGWELA